MTNKKSSIKDSLGKLESITEWFENQDEVDVEEGLKKFKEGTQLVKELKDRLKQIENEFKELVQDLEEDEV